MLTSAVNQNPAPAPVTLTLDALEQQVTKTPIGTKELRVILRGMKVPATDKDRVLALFAAAQKVDVAAKAAIDQAAKAQASKAQASKAQAPVVASKGPSIGRKMLNIATYLPRKAYKHKGKVSALTVAGAASAVRAAAPYCQPTTSHFGTSAQSAVCNAVTTVASNLTNETFVVGAAIATVGTLAYFGANAIRPKSSAPVVAEPADDEKKPATAAATVVAEQQPAPVVAKGDAQPNKKVAFTLPADDEKKPATAAATVVAEQQPAALPAPKPKTEKNSLADNLFTRFFGPARKK